MVRRRFMNNDVIDINKYLTITALEDGLTLKFPFEIEYNIDGIGWEVLQANSESSQVKKGSYILVRGNVIRDRYDSGKYFTINGDFDLSGNCLSLMYKDKANSVSSVLTPYCFASLFAFTNVRNVSKDFIPATTLSDRCYAYMFRGCSILTTAPALPATTLADGCYSSMFKDCTSLTTAPELPATTLSNSCYDWMFSGCTKLNYIKMLATDISANGCLSYWVNGVSGTGTFVKNSDMTTLPTGVSGIPSGWTVVNDGEEIGGNLITFAVNGTEYQAEEGMTFYDWAMSEYYDNSCNLVVIGLSGAHLRDNIINENVSPDDSLDIFYGSVPIMPHITTDTIIQPISYIPNFDDF